MRNTSSATLVVPTPNVPIATHRSSSPPVRTTLFEHSFGGLSANALHGVTPDVSHDASTFFGHSTFKQDGSASGVANGCSITLPFIPQAGHRYEFECHIRNFNVAAEGFVFPRFGYAEGAPSIADDTGADACGVLDPTTSKVTVDLFAPASSNRVRRGAADSTVGANSIQNNFTDPTLRDESSNLDILLTLDTNPATYRAVAFARLMGATVWTPVTTGWLDLTSQTIGALIFIMGNNSTYTIDYMKLTRIAS